ncbi:MAG TPA: hypothetical protein VKS22_06800 [Candidatus Binataceae bacterium]|nr:hypothetical protein [Candidatus Binataceae bacterium]
MDWQADAAIATIVSSVAIVASAIFVVLQLRQATRDRYFQITSHLFEIWQSPEFRDDELYLLHKLPSQVWEEFVAGGRGERAERALHRVGGFYDRVGNLIQHGLINEDDILPTIGGFAIAVWQRIEPLVLEARRRENAFLFQNFEAVLPTCRECYVPSSAEAKAAAALARSSRGGPAKESRWRRIWFSRFVSMMDFRTRRIEPLEAKRLLDQGRALILDVTRKPDPVRISGAISPVPRELPGWIAAVEKSKDVITYCT